MSVMSEDNIASPATTPAAEAAPTPAAPEPTDTLAHAIAAMDATGTPPQEAAPPVEADLEVAPPAEVAPEASATTPEPDPELTASEYYAQLTKLDRENRELKQSVKQFEATGKAGTSTDEIKAQFQKDPVAALSKMGMGLDQILSAYAGNSEPTAEPEPTAELSEEIPAMREEIAKLRKEASDREYSSNLRRHTEVISKHLIGDSTGRYDLVKINADKGSVDLVMNTASAIYEKTGQVPDYADVLDLVEGHYLKQEEDGLTARRGVPKLARHFGTPPPAAAPVPSASAAAPAPSLGGAQSGAAVNTQIREEDRLALAVAEMDRIEKSSG
jgi:hypothetical protein